MEIQIPEHIKSLWFENAEKEPLSWLETAYSVKLAAKRAKVLNKFNDSDQNLLERFSIYVIWAGRYPVPKTAEKMEYPPIKAGIDEVSFRQLFERLSQVLKAERKEY